MNFFDKLYAHANSNHRVKKFKTFPDLMTTNERSTDSNHSNLNSSTLFCEQPEKTSELLSEQKIVRRANSVFSDQNQIQRASVKEKPLLEDKQRLRRTQSFRHEQEKAEFTQVPAVSQPEIQESIPIEPTRRQEVHPEISARLSISPKMPKQNPSHRNEKHTETGALPMQSFETQQSAIEPNSNQVMQDAVMEVDKDIRPQERAGGRRAGKRFFYIRRR